MTTIDGQTQLVGVIGWPVAHSLSPAMHNAAFEHLNMNWRYLPLPVREPDIRGAIRGLASLGFRGANVTVPHKVSVISQLDSVTDAVQIVGAVNTIRVDRDTGKLEGLNTDISGFMTDLAMNDIQLDSKCNVVILGAGGAARAVAAGIIRTGARITLVNRSLDRAQQLVTFLKIGWPQARMTTVGFDGLAKAADNAHLIINCTPLGMWPNMNESAWPEALPYPKSAILYDTVYRPLETKLMRMAGDGGARVLGGLGMLVFQGATAFEAWTGKKAPIDVMRRVCADALTVKAEGVL